jgi:hypothetical protein
MITIRSFLPNPPRCQKEVEIIEGYPDPATIPGSVEVFDPGTNRLRGRLAYFNAVCEPGKERRATLIKFHVIPEYSREQVKDIAIIKSWVAAGGQMPHAIMAANSEGLADGLVVSGNQILNREGMGIAVVAVGGEKSIAPAGAFKRIRVSDNIIKGGAQPGMLLTSIRGLNLENNTVEPELAVP